MKQVLSILALLMTFCIVLCACSVATNSPASEESGGERLTTLFSRITPEEAWSMMKQEDGHIVLDARDSNAYEAGHIPGAISFPIESIRKNAASLLSDPNQIIIVYGQKDEDSCEAARLLIGQGFLKVYVFGAFSEWTGPLKQGREPGVYSESKITAALVIRIKGRSLSADLEDNISVAELMSHMEESPVSILLDDRDGVVKRGNLPWVLSGNDMEQTAVPGDLLLYDGKTIALCYGEVSGVFTKIGHVLGPDTNELINLLGKREIAVSFMTES